MATSDQHPTGSTGRFPPNAGTCDKCGMGTTWKARFTNPVTGKHIPAHVNDDGTLLGGDGDCPYYRERRKPAGSSGGTVARHVASATAPPAAPSPATAPVAATPTPPATATTAPAGATFPNDASTCSRCGGPLTWRQRVLNPATGKMMPAHLTPEGTLLGDGHCPAFAAKGARREARAPAAGAKAAPPGGADLITITIPRDVAFRLLRAIAGGGGWDES